MKVLVTGGCGFIGANLTPFLQSAGHDVVILNAGRNSAILDEVGHTGPRHLGMDVRSPGAIWQLIASSGDLDAVVHLAAISDVTQCQEDPATAAAVNINGTLNVLEACRRSLALPHPTSRVILASTYSPSTIYGAQKQACEALLTGYHATYGLETVGLRFANVYGPWQRDALVSSAIHVALTGGELEIGGDGTQTRDFIHVNDVCRGILAALQAPDAGGEIVGIGTGIETSVNNLVSILEGIHGEPLATTMTGEPQGVASMAPGDLEETMRVLGWESKKALEEGLQETYDWNVAQTNDDWTQGREPGEPIDPEIIQAFQVHPGLPLWRVEYRDGRGLKKRVEISHDACEQQVNLLTARLSEREEAASQPHTLWGKEMTMTATLSAPFPADEEKLSEYTWLLNQIPAAIPESD